MCQLTLYVFLERHPELPPETEVALDFLVHTTGNPFDYDERVDCIEWDDTSGVVCSGPLCGRQIQFDHVLYEYTIAQLDALAEEEWDNREPDGPDYSAVSAQELHEMAWEEKRYLDRR